jgi:uncharacterized protein (TIGR02594 family)
MRFLVVICIGFISACTPANQFIFDGATFSKPIFVTQITNPAFNAFQYIHFAESTHRTELKDFIGVDPVRTEWCAAFVNAVLNETGIPGSDTVSEYPLTAKSFLHWGERVAAKDIESGDIVVFPRGNESWQGHVGFYLKTIDKNGVPYYAILGGNQDNKVSIEFFKARSAISIRRYPS